MTLLSSSLVSSTGPFCASFLIILLLLPHPLLPLLPPDPTRLICRSPQNTYRNKLSLSVSSLNHWFLSLSKARAKASNGFFTINHSFCFYGDQKRRHFASVQHSQVIHPVVSALSETKAPISC